MLKFRDQAGLAVVTVGIMVIYCVMVGVLVGIISLFMGIDFIRHRWRAFKVRFQ